MPNSISYLLKGISNQQKICPGIVFRIGNCDHAWDFFPYIVIFFNVIIENFNLPLLVLGLISYSNESNRGVDSSYFTEILWVFIYLIFSICSVSWYQIETFKYCFLIFLQSLGLGLNFLSLTVVPIKWQCKIDLKMYSFFI